MRYFTIEDLKKSACAHLNKEVLEVEKPDKKQKHNNKIVEFDGFIFRSKKECGRYITLRRKQTIGEITDLQLQVPFELNEGGTHSLTYVCDFAYKVVDTGELIVEDTKGQRTKIYLKKRKLMQEIHNISIKEV